VLTVTIRAWLRWAWAWWC